jgi:prophage regulatory protein
MTVSSSERIEKTVAQPSSSMRALRLAKVLEKTGLSRTHTYRLIERGDHPKPIQLSERVYVFSEAEIDAWLKSKFEGGA